MNIYEIPCNNDGKKIRVLDLEVTDVRIYINTFCECPFCLDNSNDVQLIEESECEDKEDEYFEERLSDCFE